MVTVGVDGNLDEIGERIIWFAVNNNNMDDHEIKKSSLEHP